MPTSFSFPFASTINTTTNQQWSENIPAIMPWSTNTVQSGCSDNFSFKSMANKTPFSKTNHSDNCDFKPINLGDKGRRPKRTFNYNETQVEFDYDDNRPVKKYICDDKVLEIFDRMHIREGENYIVEDDPDISLKPNNQSNIIIEELNDYVLEFSDELKDVLKNKPETITDKILKAEGDKINKALIVWKPNNLTRLLSLNNKEKDNEEENDNTINDYLVTFNDDEQDEMIMDNDPGVLIEQFDEQIQDQPMEL